MGGKSNIHFIISTLILTSIASTSVAQLFPNSDFEFGLNTSCNCPTGYTCNNDAGRVIDGIHPLFNATTSTGCMNQTTNYTNPLGAYNGLEYVYFYAGLDAITTPNASFNGGERIKLCVWYVGPQGQTAPNQNNSVSHFSFAIDGIQISPNIQVPSDIGWTQYCQTVTMTSGSHFFRINSGGVGQYSMWFDGFTVIDSCSTYKPTYESEYNICHGESINLDVTTENATYLWGDNSTYSSIDVSQSGIYTVEIFSGICKISDTLVVTEEECDVILEMPNVFTPNNDEKNDLFLPLKIQSIEQATISIYNRWGQKIFQNATILEGWNGRTASGSIVPDGTYYWVVDYKDSKGREGNLTGFLTLLK